MGRAENISFPDCGRLGWKIPGGTDRNIIFQRCLCYPGKHPDGDGDRRPSSEQLKLCSPYLFSVLSLMAGSNLKVIVSVGRLAIDVFYTPSKTLEEIIGTQMGHTGAQVIPLPHSSGISRWHQKQEHIDHLWIGRVSSLIPLYHHPGKDRQRLSAVDKTR